MVLDAPTGRTEIETIGRDFYRAVFRAMGTVCRVAFPARSPAAARDFRDRVAGWVARYESVCSRFVPSSDVGRLNALAGRCAVKVSDEIHSLLELCDRFYWLTGGVFDPTCLPLTRLWKDAERSGTTPDDDAVECARRLVGWEKIRRQGNSALLPEAGMALDLGGIGKEYAVDRVAEMTVNLGMASVMVDFGQDIRVCGPAPQEAAWRIGLENPANPGTCWSAVALRDRAVAASGDYYRGFQVGDRRMGHVVDPKTGRPAATPCRCVTVIASSCVQAGVLAKAVLILGPDEGFSLLRTVPDADACVWTERGVHQTARFGQYVVERQVA